MMLIGISAVLVGVLASVAFTGGVHGWTVFVVGMVVVTILGVITDQDRRE